MPPILSASQTSGSGLRGGRRLGFALACLLLWPGMCRPCAAGETNAPTVPAVIDLATPPVMTGTFYEIGSDRKKVLFKFRRAAVREGDGIRVEQTFTEPDGAVDCRESIRYEKGRLVSYAMEDLRANIRGSIKVQPDPKKPGRDKILLDYLQGARAKEKSIKATETMEENTLISDTVYPHILAHWDDLARGETVKFHFISLDPARTFAFHLAREGDTRWEGHDAVRIKMEASNFIVAHWINPIYFIIEKAPPHRLFSYLGRTTPRVLAGSAWKPVDAEAVFDWK